MSDGSPSLLKHLRQFRFQKNMDVEIGQVSSTMSKSVNSTPQLQKLNSEDDVELVNVSSDDEDIKPNSRKRVAVHRVSDSEDEDTVPNRKNKVHQISDSDDEDLTAGQKKKVRCIIVSDDDDDEEEKIQRKKPGFAQVFVNSPKNGTIIMKQSSIGSNNYDKDDVICIDDDDDSTRSDIVEINVDTGNNTENKDSNKRKEVSPVKNIPEGKKKRKLHSENLKFKEENVYDSDVSSDEEISDELTPIKKKVLDYLSNASEKELRLMPTCSQKKLDSIMLLRPFTGWVDLVTKFQSAKFLGTELLNAAQQVINSREVVANLMKRCERIASQTENAITAGATSIKQQPTMLNPECKLQSYQMVGLNWLAVMFNQELNGILADEMGLGKTIQIIAFLAYLKENKHNIANQPHLIVVPASTLENWCNELEKWCPTLSFAQYYGNPDDRKKLRFKWMTYGFEGVDIILTTYSMIGGINEEKKMFRIIPFHYVVLDEAHMLKNMNTLRYENLFRIKADHRILLTGTPLQNNLLELMSLLVFIMPDMFCGKTEYLKFLFAKHSKTTIEEAPLFEQEQIERAKRIMKPFILRRLKTDVLSDLPKKTSYVIECELEDGQAQKYAELIPQSDYNYMNVFMQLRKMANHPLTLRYLYEDTKIKTMAEILAKDADYKEKDPNKIFEDFEFMSDHELHMLCDTHKCLRKFLLPDSVLVVSGKMKKLDEILPKLKEEGHRVLMFSQFVFVLNILENYMNIRGHSFLRLDGSTPVCERQEMIDLYNKDPSIFVFLLSTKAGGVGINLTAADTVIIHDVDFNPYNDKQAEDRCHRVGQTKPVSVIRFVSKGTIEELILKTAQEKLLLEEKLTTEKDSDAADNKTVLELIRSSLGLGLKPQQ